MENNKTSFFAVLSILLILLISFNGASIFFSINIPYPENLETDSRNLLSVTSSLPNFMNSVKEQHPLLVSKPQFKSHQNTVSGGISGGISGNLAGDSTRFGYTPIFSNTHLPIFRKSHSLQDFPGKNNENLDALTFVDFSGKLRKGDFPAKVDDFFSNNESPIENKQDPVVVSKTQLKSHQNLEALTFVDSFGEFGRGEFRAKVKAFFSKNESFSCKVKFFMTWISSLDSFTQKEFKSIETLFNTHPKGCLLIVSNSMDSPKGKQILNPFVELGFRVAAVSPDLNYLFKNTIAEPWFVKLKNGDINIGYVPLGQNLSNLIRLCLLYKFGGVYLDSDVMVLRSFTKLKNSIGAQTLDLDTKNWSRLNNAIMVFDKMHPLVYKFIEEFSLTFNGNKWGHNGPYLVSRVVSRVQDRPGYNFTVLPPMAFYPVNWNRVRNLFRGASNESDARWLRGKMRQIWRESYAVHLWNKQSRKLRVEEGSIVGRILLNRCVFCNSSMNSVLRIE
ncbi:uncharacterized protein At4g19900-like [Bidens hawaiensis]|uniref:uncharacterized protein At4g19900-like n=1 Tax=Bidens hawaiensis TaxID=980011 RepID=UPI004049A90A